MRICNKCNDTDPIILELPSEKIVHLCLDCRSDWGNYFDNTDVAARLMEVQCHLDALDICYSGHIDEVEFLANRIFKKRMEHGKWVKRINGVFDQWIG